tara:strand:+ start:95 stop:628 length:534 start_codon:yes stop_codon:yes gene_type:complete
MKTYYVHEGKYQKQYDRLSKLIPDMGKADTVAGEMMRAAVCLSHELYNNGMGNNCSGAVNYLQAKDSITYDTWKTIYEYSRGRTYILQLASWQGPSFSAAMESLIDQVVFFIMMNPELEELENHTNMHDLEADMQQFCVVCKDLIEEDDYSHEPLKFSTHLSVCSMCYEEEVGQWEH